MDTTKTTTHVGLCAGYGGIELGLKRVIPNLRSVALCEIEAFACANLVAKMEAGLMDPAPIWTDLKTFPWGAFRDRVDILTGGYPCQPFSAAGLRRGKDDPRHLWPWIADGIRAMRPRLCFFENVEGHISMGLSDVIEDLVGMGYRVAWGIFSAAEVGAPHQRKRMFILAVSNSVGGAAGISGQIARDEGDTGVAHHGCHQAWPARPGQPQHKWEPPRVVANSKSERVGQRSKLCSEECGSRSALPRDVEQSDPNMGDANCSRDTQPRVEQSNLPAKSSGCDTEAMGNAESGEDHRRESRDLGKEAGEWRCGNYAADGAGEVLADTSIVRCDGRPNGISGRIWEPAEVSEDATGYAGEGNGMRQTQPPLGGDADGSASGMDYAELCITCDNRTDELRLLGNGVVPATAEKAFRVLFEKLMGRS